MVGCWREFSLLHGLLFETNSSKLNAAARKDLGVVIEDYKQLPPDVAAGVKINVEGYTDSTGADAYNQGLSERRAGSVGGYLRKNGIPASIVSAAGLGEANPVDSNDTAAGRAKNRRVWVKVARKCMYSITPPR